ncbi:hypothetical protein CPB83DRAFT_899016 [Crepidotus variabilis]|uniref:DNA 3'-5' helicase n=1 Tax=Crepidotus variabilis TaxID=179855 RepID=A0A9P6E650_9AGAR|nr:hypothetical protein CPB83DRAFT_899016 [Crepidotus variabilis]
MPAIHTCEYCRSAFSTKEGLDVHTRETHATIKVKLGGKEHFVKPDQDGMYHCPCMHHLQPATYPNLKAFIAHLSAVRWVEKHLRLPPDQRPLFVGAQLVETELLSNYNLCINVQHKFILCVSCSFAVLSGFLQGHLKQCANYGMRQRDQEVFTATLSAFQLPAELPEFKAKSQPRLPGMEVKEGYACPDCHYASMLWDTLVRHRRKNHQSEATITLKQSKVSIQRLQNNNNSRWFVVSDPPTISPALDILSSLKSLTDPQPPKKRTSDPRNICPWLRTTKWDDLIQGKDISAVLALVAPPTKDDYPDLGEAVLIMFDLFGEALQMISDLNLQRVNTEDSERTHDRLNHTPFGKLRNHTTTIKQYSVSVSSLLAMLLRECPVPLPAAITADVETLRLCLSSKNVEESAEAVYQLLAKLWTHPWPPALDHRVSDPTMVYLALSTVLPDGRFKDAHFVTNPIARLKYSIRTVIVLLMRRSGLDDEQSWAMYSRWLREDAECTFRSLCSAQHIASSISYTTMSLPKVWWMDTENYTHMLYRGTPLHLLEIQTVVKRLEDTLVDMFQNHVLMKMPLRVNYTLLHDDLSKEDVGYSFINDSRNPIFPANRTTMLEAILADSDLWHSFAVQPEDGFTEVRFRHTALRIWLAKYADFQEHLLAYIYLTSGAPPRGSELTAMLMVNTSQYPKRNILACGNYTVLNCTYLKTKDQLIPHALSAFASDLLIQDLAIVRPFAQLAARVAHQSNPTISELFDTHVFINHTKLFTTEDISGRLSHLSLPVMQVELNVSTWRHVFTAFRRKLCHRLHDLIEVDDGEDIESAQMGHNGQTEKRIYGVSHHSLLGASEDVMLLYCSASTEWQIVLSVQPGGVVTSFLCARAAKVKPRPKLAPVKPELSQATVQQLEILTGRFDQLEEKADVVNAKLDRLLGLFEARTFQSSQSSDAMVPSDHTSFQAEGESVQPVFKHPSPLKALQVVLDNPFVMWKNEWQKKLVLLALEGKRDIIAVLPTSSGKSMAAIIPPSYEVSTVTVLVLPLRVLLEDYVRKLREMKVDFEVFTSATKTLDTSSNLILVAADSIPLKSWNHYIGLLNQKRRIARLIVDEAHIVLLSTGFREAMKDISVMRCNKKCQVILLTATAPDSMIAPLQDLFCLEKNPVVLRAPTNRPELKFTWDLSIKEENILKTVEEYITLYVRKPEERGIIFVASIAFGNELSTSLQIPFYNGQLETLEQRKMFVDWTSGKTRVIVATNAFGTGNDYAHVRLVIHVQAPFETTNLIQEVCRAGRDSRPAMCLLLHSKFIPQNANLEKDPLDLGGKQFMLDTMRDNNACLRFRLTLFVDGTGVYCSENPENQLCSRCVLRKETTARHHQEVEEEDAHPSVKAQRRWTAKALNKIGYVQNFKNQLKKFENSCPLCIVFGLQDAARHPYTTCPVLRHHIKHHWSKIFDFKVAYPDEAKICFYCHIPQDANKQLHGEFEKTKAGCTHPDIVLPTVYAIISHPQLLANAHKVGLLEGVKLDSQFASETIGWTKERASTGHRTTVTELFLWFADTLDI